MLSEKKTVRRSVAIALGIICVVVVAGLVGAFAYYVNEKNSTISSLNAQISSKDSQISQLNSQISDQNSTISSLNSQVINLQNQVNNLNTLYVLNKSNLQSTVWASYQTVSQPTNSSTKWVFPVNYRGFLEISVSVPPIIANGIIVYNTGEVEGIYIRVTYTFGVVRYEEQADLVGVGMTADFSVLPENIGIEVGNTKMIGNATETVTITYYY
jgi:hypothetical protein